MAAKCLREIVPSVLEGSKKVSMAGVDYTKRQRIGSEDRGS